MLYSLLQWLLSGFGRLEVMTTAEESGRQISPPARHQAINLAGQLCSLNHVTTSVAFDANQGLSKQDYHENCDVDQSLLFFFKALTRLTEENLEKIVIVTTNAQDCSRKCCHDCNSAGSRSLPDGNECE
ncbi:hypothetical protein Zmor_015265 [Zophobas morio]|uniref:Uncharacterized protein n=1 Tax=Zophobas morio TaxID=2755281 RepID=A0AA38MHE6_9CUCU|nr:hypothetical protein Zmor_015265 [Zophobas morio]